MTTEPRSNAIRRIVAMEVVSGIGDGVCWVALAAALFDRGVGAGGFALAAAARLGPRALISAPAGVLADRMDRRRLLVGLDLARAVAMVLMAIGAAAGSSAGVLLALMFLTYSLAAPYRPALTAAMPFIAGERELASANAMVGTVRQVMTFIGPLVGAAILASTDSPETGFAVNAVSFVVAAALVGGVTRLGDRTRAPRGVATGEHRPWWRDLGDGIEELRKPGAGLMVVTALVFIMYVARGLELVLLVLVVEDRLGMGASGVGILYGAVGLGALAALPAAGRIAETDRPALVSVVSVLTTALPFAALASITSAVPACLVLFVLGSGVVVFEVVSIIQLQRLARLDTLGRVFGIVNATSNAGKLLGALLAPALVALVGVTGAFAVAAAVIASVTASTIPGLMRMGRASLRRREQLRPFVEVLAGLGIFEGASRQALERVASSVTDEHVDAGSAMIIEGDPSDDLFVIREGRFTVHHGDRQINTMGPGDWFGEIGLLGRMPRTATVRAASPASVWRIPGDTFLRALQEEAAPPAALIDAMSDRLARSRRLNGS